MRTIQRRGDGQTSTTILCRKRVRMGATTALKTVGLFSGIGGFELGLANAGHEITSLCEIDPSARAVLRKRFDGFKVEEDVRLISGLPRGTELVVAGFPCQDLSQVGQ